MIGAGLSGAKPGARTRAERSVARTRAERSVARRWRGGETWPRAAWAQLAAWAEEERGRFVLLAPLLMIAGIAAYLSLPAEPPSFAGPGAVLIGAGGWFLGARRDEAALRVLGRGVFFAALGFALIQARSADVAAPMIRAETPPVTVEGVLERAEKRGPGLRYTVRVIRVGGFAEEDTPGRVRVSWRGRGTDAAPGDTVRLRAVLSPPPGPSLPGGYDYGRQLWFEGIGGVGYAYGPARVIVPDESPSLAARTERLREAVADRVQAGAGERVGGLAAALVTGKRERVPEPIVETLRDTGLAHLLAISGLHMGLVCGVLFGGVRAALALSERAALCWPVKKIAALAAITGGAAYLVLSGAPVSAQRAFVMALVVFGAVLFDRRAISLRNVSLAAILVLLLRPEAAAGAGFQMSFMAVTVLVAAYGWLDARRRADALARLTRSGRAARFLGGLFGTSLLAGIATGPFAAYHFGRIAVWGLPANMAVMPLVTLVVMPVAVAGLLLMPLGLDAPAWWLMGRGLEGAVALAAWFEALPGAVRLVPTPPRAAWLLTVAAMLALALLAAPWRIAGLALLPVAVLVAGQREPPDVFVGREARQVAVRVATPDGEALSLASRRRDRFSTGVWLSSLGLPPVIRDQPKFGECGGEACTVRMRDGGTLALARTDAAAGRACREAAVVVYTGWRPASLGECAALLLTTQAVAETGPLTITQGRVRTVADARGCRPWTGCGGASP